MGVGGVVHPLPQATSSQSNINCLVLSLRHFVFSWASFPVIPRALLVCTLFHGKHSHFHSSILATIGKWKIVTVVLLFYHCFVRIRHFFFSCLEMQAQPFHSENWNMLGWKTLPPWTLPKVPPKVKLTGHTIHGYLGNVGDRLNWWDTVHGVPWKCWGSVTLHLVLPSILDHWYVPS